MNLQELTRLVRDVPDFPKEGIVFKDITPILADPHAFGFVTESFVDRLKDRDIGAVLGIESRGFIFGAVLAGRLSVPFVPVRKKGKLPWKTKARSYALEYGEAEIEIHEDAVKPGTKVAVVDDLLATGGTAEAAAKLVEDVGGKVSVILFLIELTFLSGRKKLSQYDVASLIRF